MHLLSGRRALHIPSWLTLPHNQVWTHTLHFSWLTLGKEQWWGREKAKQHDWGAKYFQPKHLLNQSHENSGAIQYWTEETTRKHLTDEATCLWELSSALLSFLFHFYSSTFLLEFSLSDIMDVLVLCTHVCRRESLQSVKLNLHEAIPIFHFSGLWKPWIHMTGFPNYAKRRKKLYIYILGIYIWPEIMKLYKIIVEKSIFVTELKDPGHREKQLEFRKLTMSRPLL